MIIKIFFNRFYIQPLCRITTTFVKKKIQPQKNHFINRPQFP